METTEKNCPNCKHFRKEEEKILVEREGKILETQYSPKRCLKRNHEILVNWFKTKEPIALDCFEEKL